MTERTWKAGDVAYTRELGKVKLEENEGNGYPLSYTTPDGEKFTWKRSGAYLEAGAHRRHDLLTAEEFRAWADEQLNPPKEYTPLEVAREMTARQYDRIGAHSVAQHVRHGDHDSASGSSAALSILTALNPTQEQLKALMEGGEV